MLSFNRQRSHLPWYQGRPGYLGHRHERRLLVKGWGSCKEMEDELEEPSLDQVARAKSEALMDSIATHDWLQEMELESLTSTSGVETPTLEKHL
ncbi:hypothetical protein NDU88_006363 [Pleurodeles waltl]|uniref:Uncharacterized protein n=1 Tax=Pleurodeles waltl TaxID=8319 RepID=A0AAV7TXG5_PLEWA|nr:hypothetical protein NDU88_006363 [Pleurodeles waltl]